MAFSQADVGFRFGGMTIPELVRQIADIASLEEPVRRDLYFFVAAAAGPVSRDEAARAVRVTRALAAFHLDKLVAAGLLEASYRRLTRRGGPGAGRPAKLYRRSARQVELSLPQRRYELAARLMAESLVTPEAGAGAGDGVRAAARQLGVRLGRAAIARAGARPSRTRILNSAFAVLREHGYEPARDAQTIRMRNCPFDALARDYRSLVCGMNLALMEGLLAGLDVTGIKAELDPQPGLCCVALRSRR